MGQEEVELRTGGHGIPTERVLVAQVVGDKRGERHAALGLRQLRGHGTAAMNVGRFCLLGSNGHGEP